MTRAFSGDSFSGDSFSGDSFSGDSAFFGNSGKAAIANAQHDSAQPILPATRFPAQESKNKLKYISIRSSSSSVFGGTTHSTGGTFG